ncbi:MAG: pentapeptide repeat-containing protein [Motiliproteus sp.]
MWRLHLGDSHFKDDAHATKFPQILLAGSPRAGNTISCPGMITYLWRLMAKFWRLLFLAEIAIIVGIVVYWFDQKERVASRINTSWQLVNTMAQGSSGKIEALQYLNSWQCLFYLDEMDWFQDAWKRERIGARDSDGLPRLAQKVFCLKKPIELIDIDLSLKKNGPESESNQQEGAEFEVGVGTYLAGIQLPGANLRGSDFRNADLSGANLRGANLYGANLYGANLRRADLSGASLVKANITGANLNEASLREAFLNSAKLINANLSNANLSKANLSGANLREANLSGANLSEANLSTSDLLAANLSGANLREANLSTSNLREANLSGANLTDAFLGFSSLTHAVLFGADLRGANLQRIYIAGTLNEKCLILQDAEHLSLAFRDPEYACGEDIPLPEE